MRGLGPEEVAALGYDLVFGNTFHLFLSPGGELVERFGGLHRFMGWSGAVITDSGGFQVFSMGHGTVADEIKGSRSRPGGGHGGPRSAGAILAIEEDGVRFRSYVDGSERFLSPEISMQVQAQLRSDIVLAFDECTPFHVDRDYTARSTERTHRWLARAIAWRAEHDVRPALFYGIVQGGVYEDLRIESVAAVRRQRRRRGRDRRLARPRQGADVRGRRPDDTRARARRRAAAERPRHLLGIGEIDDLIRGVELGIDTFDCAMPTRLARHGVALVPDPAERWRMAVDSPRRREDAAPLVDGCPCAACAGGLSRAYLHYLARAGELTAARLLTLHNLTFVAGVMGRLRDAIIEGRLAEVADALRRGV